MTYEEIVDKAREALGSADVSSYEGHLAIQVNITGEGEGIFYVEISEGNLNIQPYDYKANDAVLTAEGKDIIKIFNGTLDPVKAYESKRLFVDGDISKALSIQPVIENNKKSAKKPAAAAKKTAAKKTADNKKKASAEKETAKAVKEAKNAAKSAPKAPKASKPTIKKAEEEVKPLPGLSDPKKVPAKVTAPKTAAKKTTPKAAKEQTKSAKKKSTASKKG